MLELKSIKIINITEIKENEVEKLCVSSIEEMLHTTGGRVVTLLCTHQEWKKYLKNGWVMLEKQKIQYF